MLRLRRKGPRCQGAAATKGACPCPGERAVSRPQPICYGRAIDTPLHDYPADDLDAELERIAMEDDDSEATELLAAGHAIHIAYDDTPEGHVVRVYPDGREELVKVDWEEAARILGR